VDERIPALIDLLTIAARIANSVPECRSTSLLLNRSLQRLSEIHPKAPTHSASLGHA
jgi:hypothetical protein